MSDARFKAQMVGPQLYQVVDTKHNVEFCVVQSFDGESAPAEDRAKTIAGALNVADIMLNQMRSVS